MPIEFSNGDIGLSALGDIGTEEVAIEITEAAGRELTRRAREATPVDSGNTRARWRQTAVERKRNVLGPAYETRAENNSYVARFLERGVDPHVIEPDSDEALEIPGGVDHPVARVDHPGFRGRHMSQTAAATVERDIGEIAEPAIQRYAAEVEEHTQTGH